MVVKTVAVRTAGKHTSTEPEGVQHLRIEAWGR